MDPAIVMTLRFSFALLLGAAALHKLGDLERFRATLAEYDILPAFAVRGAAPALAAVEAVLAAMLAAGVVLSVSAAAAAVLLLTYAAAIRTNVARGRTDLDCGCMGPAARVPVSSALVVRNLLLAGGAAAMLVPSSGRVLHWVDAASVLAATLVLAASWLATERMLALAPRAAELRSRSRRRA